MPQVTLRRLKLRNFLSHADTEISFDRGVTVFIGRNGAGKSSILEAVYYAVTGKGWRTRGNERKPLIKEGTSAATVEAWFDVDGEELYIKRTVSRKGRAETEVRFGKEVVRSDAAASRRLRELLGLDHAALKMVAILPQGGITELFVGVGGSERKALVDRLLGLDAYEKTWDVLGQYVLEASLRRGGTYTVTPVDRQLNAVRESLRRLADEVNSKKRDYEGEVRKATSLKDEAVRLEGKVKEAESRLRKAQEELEALREVEKRAAGIEEAIKHIELELRDAKSRFEDLRMRIEEAEEKLSRKKEISRKAEALQKARDLMEIDEKVRKTYETLRRREEALKTLEVKVKALRELREEVRRGSADIEAELKELKEMEERLRQEVTELREKLSSLKTSVRSKEAEALKLEGEVNAVVEKASKLLNEAGTPEDLLKKAKQDLEEGEAKERELRERLDSLRGEEASLNERLRKIEEDLTALKEGGKAGKCPLCGQPLTPQHAEVVAEKLSAELREAKERVPRIREEIEDAEAELKALRERIKELSNISVRLERAVTLWKEMEEALKDVESLKEEVRRVEGEVERKETALKDLKAKVSVLENELETAKRYESLREAVSEDVYEDLRKEVEELKDEFKELVTRQETLKNELTEIFETSLTPEGFLKGAEEASKELKGLEALEGELGRLREELREVEERIKSLTSRRDSLLKERAEISAKVERVKELEESVRRLTDELMRLREESSSIQTQIRSAEERISELREEITDLQEDLRTLLKLWLKAEVLRWVRTNIFHKDKAPQKLRAAYLTHAEEIVRELLNSFNLQYSDVRIDEEFNIFLKGPGVGGEGIEIGRLSGGEKVVASLLTLLALHRIVSRGRLGFLALDEPTEYLDDERRKTLIEVLKEFKGGEHIKQLIVVTHDEEVKEAADTMFEVVNDGRTSRVREVSLYE
ncbi:MAG: SMC family ATPase [Desulfurococcales archaeon]|nr:SMC family ATPase [Desulfurococcales archaeon]